MDGKMKKENGIMKNEKIYQDEKGYYHLIRDGIDLLEGKHAIACRSYPNGDYGWEEEKKYCHLVRDGIDLLEGKKAIWCHSYPNGDYGWTDEKGEWHHEK